jgi:hypothetical protein
MGKIDFDEYIKKTAKDETRNRDFRDRELTEWRYYLDALYDKVRGWLSEYIDKGQVNIDFHNKKIYEEFSGEYEVPEMLLSFSERHIIFEPIGTMLVGAKGRVNITGKNGSVAFILVDKKLNRPNIQVNIFTSRKEREEFEKNRKPEDPSKKEWEWKIFSNNDSSIEYIPLTEDNFFDVIMGLIGG